MEARLKSPALSQSWHTGPHRSTCPWYHFAPPPSTLKSCIASHHLLQLCTFYGLLCVGSHMPPFYCSAPQPEQYIVPKCTDGACFVSFVVFQSFLQVPHFCRLASLKGDKLRPCWGNNCIVESIPSKCDIDDCVGKDHWKGFDIAL